MMKSLTLVSHHLCPYVQRAAIALSEKGASFAREYVDLAAKPDWFLALSPLGKVPLLKVVDDDGRDSVLFESAVICEFLEDTIAPALHPQDPLLKARHRAWVEYASAALNDIAALYNAPDRSSFLEKQRLLTSRLERLEPELMPDGPFFGGRRFSLVDAAFAPVFRYFTVFRHEAGIDILSDLKRLEAWSEALLARTSVKTAVAADYGERLRGFIEMRGSYLSSLLLPARAAA
jgi:glutathione S-transferase